MQVIRAKTAGFCMGVSRALEVLDAALKTPHTGRLITFGPIIHNPQVLKMYEEKGVICLEDPDALQAGDTVIIRAHGLPRQIEKHLQEYGVTLVDATCPRVKSAQMAIADATQRGERLFLFGEEAHPEVRGLVSYAQGECFVFSDPAEAMAQPVRHDEHLILAAQTTQDRAIFESAAAALLQRTSHLRILSTICGATSRRQQEAQQLSQQVDAMVVIGGLSSGNTRRLAMVAQSGGIPAVQIEGVNDLPRDELARFTVLGLTAGASTPKATIDSVQAELERLPSAHEQAVQDA